MKVLFYEPYGIYEYHFETSLEIIQTHLDKGDEVIFIGCDGNFTSCDVNIFHNKLKCLKCVSRRKEGMKLLSPRIRYKNIFNTDTNIKNEFDANSKHLSSIEELKNYRTQNFDIGYSVLSTLISEIRDPWPKLDKYEKTISELITTSLNIYYSMRHHIQIEKPDRVYAFNGRLCIQRAVLRACEFSNVDCFLHERGANIHKYSLFKNAMPHDIAYVTKKINESWALADKSTREKIGSDFFIDKRDGGSTRWYSFTSAQNDELPKNWDESKYNIAIFDSSEDEFISISDNYVVPYYGTQFKALSALKEESLKQNKIHFYLRMHPNQKNSKNRDYIKTILNLDSKNFTVVPPESPISSYSLMNAVSKVISFGSTMGIEATFWGKPSILIGKCLYSNLDGTHQATTHEEVLSLINNDIECKERGEALKFGLYFNTFGYPFKYYKAKNFREGIFKGKPVRPNLLMRSLERIYKFLA